MKRIALLIAAIMLIAPATVQACRKDNYVPVSGNKKDYCQSEEVTRRKKDHKNECGSYPTVPAPSPTSVPTPNSTPTPTPTALPTPTPLPAKPPVLSATANTPTPTPTPQLNVLSDTYVPFEGK